MNEQDLLHIIQEETEKVVQERKLKKSEKAKLKILKKSPRKTLKTIWQKGHKVYYATLTNMAKVNEEELDERCQKATKLTKHAKPKDVWQNIQELC